MTQSFNQPPPDDPPIPLYLEDPVPKQNVSGEKCQDCGKRYHYIYRVPDDVWSQIAPSQETLNIDLGGLLCVDCADKRARERGITLYFEGSQGWWHECSGKEETPSTINIDDFKIAEFDDGSVCLECGEGPKRDLVFAAGAMTGDPDLDQQRKILEFILKSIKTEKP